MTRGYKSVALGDIVELIMGQAPPGKETNFDGLGTPFVKVGEFGTLRPIIREWTTNPLRTARRTDVLLCVVGATCGKINLGIDCAIGRSVAALRPTVERIDQLFLYYFMLTLVERLRAGSVGAAQTVISKEMIGQEMVPLPPLPEQRRIVRILDEAFEAIATAKANTEKNLQNARAIFESHLEEVFTQRGPGWVEKKLKAVTTKIGSGATPRGGETSYKSEGVSLIRSLNVYDLGFRYVKLAFLDEVQARELSNVEVQSRDVLLNITGASIARCCIVPDDILPARVNQHVSIVRPNADKVDPEFLHYLLVSRPYKNQLLRTGEEGGSTRQAITKGQIQEFSVDFPVLVKDQRTIVRGLTCILEETQRLSRLYEEKGHALESLKKSLLHQAFAGKL